jgi:hypothetical protein
MMAQVVDPDPQYDTLVRRDERRALPRKQRTAIARDAVKKPDRVSSTTSPSGSGTR